MSIAWLTIDAVAPIEDPLSNQHCRANRPQDRENCGARHEIGQYLHNT